MPLSLGPDLACTPTPAPSQSEPLRKPFLLSLLTVQRTFDQLGALHLAGLSLEQTDNPVCTIHFNHLPVLQDCGGVFNPSDARFPIFPRHQRAMLKQTTDLKNDAAGIEKQGRPSWVRRPRHQDLTGQDRLFVWLVEHLDLAAYNSR